mgnify:CR=1 FL=1
MIIADDASFMSSISEEYRVCLEIKPKSEILKLLGTSDPEYTAVISGPWGLMNSALFCEKLFEMRRRWAYE